MLGNHDISTRAVVVSRAQSGEGSVRVFLYTEHAGLIGALAKSAREERSKLRPHLQIGSFGMYTLVRGARDWRLIGAVDTENSYFELVDNANAQSASARVFSVLRQLVHGEEKNETLFFALWAYLESLGSFNENEIRTAERLAVVRILSALGYVPPQYAVPHLDDDTYSSAVLTEVAPYEKQLVKAINDALLASNLV